MRPKRFVIRFRRLGFAALAAVLLTLSARAVLADEGVDYFKKRVRPLLVAKCYACHSGTKNSGGLSLETAAGWRKGGESGPAIVPGEPDESLLIDAVEHGSLEMPPPDTGGKLSAEEIAVLRTWIATGAADPREEGDSLGGMSREVAETWWAFQPLPDATGLPSPAAINAFIADETPEAFERVADRLLASPQYGVRWGRHWLDVVRSADTAGENTDRPLPHAWRYRNWVVDAFNRDLAYDEFVRLQLCGDVVAAGGPPEEVAEGVVATGHLAISRRFGHDIDKDRYVTHEEVIDNLGKNFLGMTLGCARCHDHKYDPVTAEDYYALYGVLESVRFSFPGCEAQGQPRDLMPLIPPSEAEAANAEFRKRLADYERHDAELLQEGGRLKESANRFSSVLAEASVGEGEVVDLAESGQGRLARVALRKGEALQLAISPNANHGADTTRVELEIASVGDPTKRWNLADLVPRFASDSSLIESGGATWCLLENAEALRFLNEKRQSVEGRVGLNAWTIGDTPSALVNTSEEAISVWTALPANSFFLHPGPQTEVALVWICPEDGEYAIQGTVGDAHPTGLDGVRFRLERIASAEFGAGLLELGQRTFAVREPRPKPPAIPVAYAVAESEPRDARVHLRGDPEQLGEAVSRRWLSFFGGEPLANAGGSGRQELAERIVQHPLFARVMVNRVWLGHFGRGLVGTPNDFGARGESPSHPELLDALAAGFRADGFRLKALHRSILLTEAYRRSSDVSENGTRPDPENRWLARFAQRRLSAEEIRDSLLAASGGLDLTPGAAHPFPPEAEWKYTQHDPFAAVYETDGRSLYLMVQRQRRHPFLALFDGADPNASTPLRGASTVPTQALFFRNDPFFHEQAGRFAEQLEAAPDEEARSAWPSASCSNGSRPRSSWNRGVAFSRRIRAIRGRDGPRTPGR
ncbi:MAG TPA: PSD1 and planctomycete cytochrome C domain-containing protein [Pirellulaceae bacterium]|jgi:hypothetical protein|nr:PSD1 and planctomycete cytochrome C domain-containing protein [Pirellulaceae bacterium]